MTARYAGQPSAFHEIDEPEPRNVDMDSRFEVERHDDDQLKGQKWTFVFFFDGLGEVQDPLLALDQYIEWEKPSRRHKHKVTGIFERLSRRDSTIEHPPLPSDVIAEVTMKFLGQITLKLRVQ